MSQDFRNFDNNDIHITPIERSEHYFQRAKNLSAIGNSSSIEIEKILKDVFKAISFYPDHVQHFMFLGKVFKQGLDITSAIFCYRYALKLDPLNYTAKKMLCELLVLKGKELMIIGEETGSKLKYVSARACFDESLDIDKDDISIWIMKAICHVYLDELTEAFESVNRLIKPGKTISAEILILRAKIYWARGLLEQGNADIRTAGSIDPNHPEVLDYISRCYVKTDILYNKALEEFKNENFKEALIQINYALYISPKDIKLYIMQSKINRMLGDHQASYSSILEAKKLYEQMMPNPDLRMNLPVEISIQTNLILNDISIKYATEGDYEKAILILNRIIKSENSLVHGELDPVDSNYYRNRGDCLRALNRLDEAILDYKTALKLDPYNWEIKTRLSVSHYLIAVQYFNESKFFESKNELDKAIDFNPKVSSYYSIRGKAFYYLSEYQNSYRDFKKALELDPNNEEIQQRINQFDDEIKKEKSNSRSKIKLGITKHQDSSYYKNEKKVSKAEITPKLLVSALLQAKNLKKLPTLKLLSNDV